MKSSVSRLLLGFAVAAVSLQLSGCADQPTQLHAAESLQYGNPMKKVALLGTGHVFLMGKSNDKKTFIGLQDSKTALESQVHGVKDELKQLGYKVTYAAPAGIGYGDWEADGAERWVDANGKDRQLTGDTPAYVYPSLAANAKYRSAVGREFIKIATLLGKDKIGEYAPEKADLKVIQQATGADTICFMTVYGYKYSSGQKTASTAENVGGAIFGLFSPITIQSNLPDDSVHTSLVCNEAKTGQVMWQSVAGLDSPPATGPAAGYYQAFLNTFPKKGAKITSKCTFADKSSSVYNCTENSSN